MAQDELIRVRMYTGLPSLFEGLAKNVVDMAGGPGRTRARPPCAGPRLGLRFGSSLAAGCWQAGTAGVAAPAVALVGSLALLGTHLAGARHIRIPPWYGLLFPLGYTLAAGVALYAVLCHARGAVVWKGRVYAPPGNEGSP